MGEGTEPDESFGGVGAVFYRRRRVGKRGKLAVLEIIDGGEGGVRLSDPAGRELFRHPPSELRVKLVTKRTFRVQHGEERWWLWGTAFHNGRGIERMRRRIARDDVVLVLPRFDMDERLYTRIMLNVDAQQQAWRGVWVFELHWAGAQLD